MKVLKFTSTPTRPLLTLLAGDRALDPGERETVLQLRDLLEQCLALDPARRITPVQALRHPFISG